MEAVSQHEHVVDLRSHIADRQRDDAPDGPVEQRADIQGPGRALSNVRQEVREREAGVLFENDEEEEQVEQFREFLDQVKPEDFAQ